MNTLPVNIWKLLILFVFLLVALHWLLVRWLKPNKVGWKRVDYIWLGIAALGLISMSTDVRNWLAVEEAKWAKERAEAKFSLLRYYAGGDKPPEYICIKFVRNEQSPDDFDEIQAEYDEFCEWNKRLLADLPTRLPDDDELPDLKYPDYKPEKNPKNKVLIEYISNIKKYFEYYQTDRNEYITLKKASFKSDFEKTLFYLSPILLCIALALRITKVTGEIKLEK